MKKYRPAYGFVMCDDEMLSRDECIKILNKQDEEIERLHRMQKSEMSLKNANIVLRTELEQLKEENGHLQESEMSYKHTVNELREENERLKKDAEVLKGVRKQFEDAYDLSARFEDAYDLSARSQHMMRRARAFCDGVK